MAPALSTLKISDFESSLTIYDQFCEPNYPDLSVEKIQVKPTLMKDLFSCPICLNLLKETMVATSCCEPLHRFCKQCIYKTLAENNKKCPVCRKEITQGQLLADAAFDGMITIIFPNGDVVEGEGEKKENRTESSTSNSAVPQEDLEVTISAIPEAISGCSNISNGRVRFVKVPPSATIFHVAKYLKIRHTNETGGESGGETAEEDSAMNAPWTYPFTIFCFGSIIAEKRSYLPLVGTDEIGNIATKYKALTSAGEPLEAGELSLFYAYKMDVSKYNDTLSKF